MAQTWIINENPTIDSNISTTETFYVEGGAFTFIDVIFQVTFMPTIRKGIKFGNKIVYKPSYGWYDSDFSTITTYELTPWKKITFLTNPTDALLTWLQANATLQPSTETVTIDLTTLTGWESLSSGAHTITVKAKADGYKDSLASQGVSVTKPSSGYKLTFVGYGGDYVKINGINIGDWEGIEHPIVNGDIITVTNGMRKITINGVQYSSSFNISLSNTDIAIVQTGGFGEGAEGTITFTQS